MEAKHNILVIGKTGSGKGSLINLILGCNKAAVSDSISRGTSEFKWHRYKNYQLVDTIGYSDTEENSITESLCKLEMFLGQRNNDEIVLIIFVVRKGKINPCDLKNYKLLLQAFVKEKVPVLLVVTHCELDPPTENWFLKEKEKFAAISMTFAGHVCGCAIDISIVGDTDMVSIYQGMLSKTQKAVREMIDQLALTPYRKLPYCAAAIKNILVLGEVGVGKSSVINLVLGSNQAAVSDSRRPETLESRWYAYGNYKLLDTVGLNVCVYEMNEPNQYRYALELRNHIRSLDDGVALLIFVMRLGRVNKTFIKHYEVWVETVCEGKVPVLLVVTHCEFELRNGDWYLEEIDKMRQYGVAFSGCVHGCSVDIGDIFDPVLIPLLQKKRLETQRAVRQEIQELTLLVPWKPTSWIDRIKSLFW